MRALLLGIGMALLAACGAEHSELPAAGGGGAAGLRFLRTGGGEGFARASETRELLFPQDHGNHPDFQTEWWYFTGNLSAADDRSFGFQVTFFRFALAPGRTGSSSGWRTNQTWMAHFALTDQERGEFVARERMAREAVGVAGVAESPLRVWVKDWSMLARTDGDGLAVHLVARDGDVGVSLDLATDRAPVANGDRGLDRKGAERGNASYYYSVPGLAVTGAVVVDGQALPVTGIAWLDREWGTSTLSAGVVGWDWFSLQATNGASLMFYRLREEDGRASAFSAGTLVDSVGRVRRLEAGDVELVPRAFWTSDATGSRYPVAWSVSVPTERIALEVESTVERQELDLSVRYWEGAVRAEGTWNGESARAVGYVELTGY